MVTDGKQWALFMTPVQNPFTARSSSRSRPLKLSTKAFCAGLPGDHHRDAEAAPVDELIGQEVKQR